MILDLFCGQGGASMGIHQALPDHEIIGIDIKPQPRYPFTFIQMDALEALWKYGKDAYIIWASPPCQGYIVESRFGDSEHRYDKLVPEVRRGLRRISRPYIIENVVQAPLNAMRSIVLCGNMFNLSVYRHRRFETNPSIKCPQHANHEKDVIGKTIFTVAGHSAGTLQQWSDAMGINWMDKVGLRQAIPPAFARYCTEQLVLEIEKARMARTSK